MFELARSCKTRSTLVPKVRMLLIGLYLKLNILLKLFLHQDEWIVLPDSFDEYYFQSNLFLDEAAHSLIFKYGEKNSPYSTNRSLISAELSPSFIKNLMLFEQGTSSNILKFCPTELLFMTLAEVTLKVKANCKCNRALESESMELNLFSLVLIRLG